MDIIEPEGDELTHLFIVTERAKTDLRTLITEPLLEYTDQNVKVILYNCLCALNYIHSGNIIHRDLKPSNILINEDSSVQLCDFGMSRVLPDMMEHEVILQDTHAMEYGQPSFKT